MADTRSLIERYVVGELTDAEHAELTEWLEADEANRRAFLAEIGFYHTVRGALTSEQREIAGGSDEQAEGVFDGQVLETLRRIQASADGEAVLNVDRLFAEQRAAAGAPEHISWQDVRLVGSYVAKKAAHSKLVVSGAAAAVLLITASVFIAFGGLFDPPEPIARGLDAPGSGVAAIEPAVAKVVGDVDAVWDYSVPAAKGQAAGLIGGSRLELSEGLLSLRTASDAEIVLEGPAEVQFIDERSVRLIRGKLFSVCERPGSQGFTVHTEHARVVDIGTKFGVHVERGGNHYVHVDQGEVVVKPLSSENTRVRQLFKGQALLIDEAGQNVQRTDKRPLAFVTDAEFEIREAVASPQHRRWLAASYELRKHEDLVAYYTFDLDPEHPGGLQNMAVVTRGRLNGRLASYKKQGQAQETQGPAWSEGRWPGKGALRFDRDLNQMARVPFGQADEISRSLSIVIWARFDELGVDQHLVAQAGPAASGKRTSLNLGWNGPRNEFPARTLFFSKEMNADNFRNRFRVAPPFEADEWVCLAITWDGRQTVYYLNGEPFAEYDDVVAYRRSGADLTIGFADHMRDHQEAFGGSIDELAIFKTALTGKQVATMYESGKP